MQNTQTISRSRIKNHLEVVSKFHYFYTMCKTPFYSVVLCLAILAGCNTQTKNTADKIVDNSSTVGNDSTRLLNQYWVLADADNPMNHDVSFTDENGIPQESGIVFINDTSLLENPAGDIKYAHFRRNGDTVYAVYNKERKAKYIITALHKDKLLLDRFENKHNSKLTYKPTNTWWPDDSKNPFTRENYSWAQRPKSSETAQQINERVKKYVRFCGYYLNGFVNGDANQLDFAGLPNCLQWYQGGIMIESAEKLDKKWAGCFFSHDQALEGRQLLEDALMKKYDWDTTQKNWLLQTSEVLKQIYQKM